MVMNFWVMVAMDDHVDSHITDSSMVATTFRRK